MTKKKCKISKYACVIYKLKLQRGLSVCVCVCVSLKITRFFFLMQCEILKAERVSYTIVLNLKM